MHVGTLFLAQELPSWLTFRSAECTDRISSFL